MFICMFRAEDGTTETHYLFYDGETVSGTVNITLKKQNQKLEHQGIRVEFIGQIGWFENILGSINLSNI